MPCLLALLICPPFVNCRLAAEIFSGPAAPTPTVEVVIVLLSVTRMSWAVTVNPAEGAELFAKARIELAIGNKEPR